MNSTPAHETERRSRSAVGTIASFLRDLVALGELQAMLLVADAADEFRKARTGLLLIAGFAVIAVSCVPLGLAGAALLLAEHTELTIGQSLLCVAALGLVVASAVIGVAGARIRPDGKLLKRSRSEWQCNVRWMKETLKHVDGSPADPCGRQGNGFAP
ncbi:MAG: phage holin family protein [Planctomycetia bacterium]|nr:phage holin family protein [Planctomycetia bacterium]